MKEFVKVSESEIGLTFENVRRTVGKHLVWCWTNVGTCEEIMLDFKWY